MKFTAQLIYIIDRDVQGNMKCQLLNVIDISIYEVTLSY